MRTAPGLLMLAIALPVIAQDVVSADLAGRPVDLTLVRVDDLSIVAFPAGDVRLKTESVTLTRGTNIYLLLQSKGIAPDPESFAAVYDLNPIISDLNGLTARSSIVLPVVVPGPGLNAMLQHGYLVALTLDPDVRRSLNDRIALLQTFKPSIDSLTSDHRGQSQLRDLIEWFAQIHNRFIRRTEPPLRHDSLKAMNDEAGVIVSMLENATKSTEQLTSAQLSQVNALHADVQDDIFEYKQVLADIAPRAQAQYKVTVRVLGAPDHLANVIRIYYTYNGLFQNLPATPPIPSYPFDQLGSIATRTMTMKNYQIWAARDGDPNHPVTIPHLLAIDSVTPSELTVDLSIQHDSAQ